MYRVDAHLNKNNLFCRIKSAHVFGSCFIQILKSKVVTPGPLMLSCAQYSMINSSRKHPFQWDIQWTRNELWTSLYEKNAMTWKIMNKTWMLFLNKMESKET